MSIRVNVSTEGLEQARMAIGRAEELCAEGFDHVSEVTAELTRIAEGAEEFRRALNAALSNVVA